MRTNENGLFPAIEAVLRAATEPLDCVALFDMPEKETANTLTHGRKACHEILGLC